MKLLKYFCDICNTELTLSQVKQIHINNVKYDLCTSCLNELRTKTLEYIEEMKENNENEEGEE